MDWGAVIRRSSHFKWFAISITSAREVEWPFSSITFTASRSASVKKRKAVGVRGRLHRSMWMYVFEHVKRRRSSDSSMESRDYGVLHERSGMKWEKRRGEKLPTNLFMVLVQKVIVDLKEEMGLFQHVVIVLGQHTLPTIFRNERLGKWQTTSTQLPRKVHSKMSSPRNSHPTCKSGERQWTALHTC